MKRSLVAKKKFDVMAGAKTRVIRQIVCFSMVDSDYVNEKRLEKGLVY